MLENSVDFVEINMLTGQRLRRKLKTQPSLLLCHFFILFPPLHFRLLLVLSFLHSGFSTQCFLPSPERETTTTPRKTTLRPIIFTPSIILPVFSPFSFSGPLLSLIFNKAVSFEVFWRGQVFLCCFFLEGPWPWWGRSILERSWNSYML